ncbi:hypothetical protein N1851_001714 [Merluccius polli]|uniref:PLAT domain-containing protein n=1 Tax=Merluccius polli TaxID=89951 RepID=A0AA47P984_MERPO|nr:hypothetical protein N1851_001714 [Merluccius polli]
MRHEYELKRKMKRNYPRDNDKEIQTAVTDLADSSVELVEEELILTKCQSDDDDEDGDVDFTFEVKTKDIGKLVLIKLEKTRRFWLPEKTWLPAKMVITSDEQKNRKEETSDGETSDGETYHFPIYHWITNQEVQVFREGTGSWDKFFIAFCSMLL